MTQISSPLAGRRILLIVGGGIAAYKSLDLVRRLRERGGSVRGVLTAAAKQFITPLSLASLTGETVHEDLFSLTDEAQMGHIELSRWADIVLVAPATADLMAKVAHGLANDLASTLLLATDKGPVFAPAMNVRMWLHPATLRNVETLRGMGGLIVGPDDGVMACGEFGPGRLAEPLAIVAALRSAGTGVIYITHRLGEVVSCADRVLCLRDGRVAGELPREGIAHPAMTRLMIGRALQSLHTPPAGPPGDGGLEVDRLVPPAFPDRRASLHARPGEILGLAGLVGSGRTSLARTLFGIEPALGGAIRLDGHAVRIGSPRDAIARGLYLVPEDRKRSGLVLTMPISQNVTLPALAGHSRLGLISPASEAQAGEAQRTALRIKAPNAAVQAGMLSGGNQQKVVLGRWLALNPRAIVFDEPTRGVDVGAKGEIYGLMRALADRGVAVLMISSDMEEVIGVSDRVAVMHEGRVAGVLDRPDFSEDAVLHLAIGHAAAA